MLKEIERKGGRPRQYSKGGFGSPGTNPRLLIAAGKAGNMYLLDATRIHQVNRLATYPIGPCWCGPSFYQGADGVYRVVSSVIIWDLATSDSAPAALTQERAVLITSGQDGGFFTSVSSNGVQPGTAIIWAVGRPTSIPGAPTLYATTRPEAEHLRVAHPEAGRPPDERPEDAPEGAMRPEAARKRAMRPEARHQ